MFNLINQFSNNCSINNKKEKIIEKNITNEIITKKNDVVTETKKKFLICENKKCNRIIKEHDVVYCIFDRFFCSENCRNLLY
jgi:hypothetical protein